MVRRKKLESQKQVIDSLTYRGKVSRGRESLEGRSRLKKSPVMQMRLKNLRRLHNRNGRQTQEWPQTVLMLFQKTTEGMTEQQWLESFRIRTRPRLSG